MSLYGKMKAAWRSDDNDTDENSTPMLDEWSNCYGCGDKIDDEKAEIIIHNESGEWKTIGVCGTCIRSIATLIERTDALEQFNHRNNPEEL